MGYVIWSLPAVMPVPDGDQRFSLALIIPAPPPASGSAHLFGCRSPAAAPSAQGLGSDQVT